MVILHRYRNSGSSNKSLSKLGQDDHPITSVSKSKEPDRRLVPAADFCPECASIVEVELECTGEGEFVSEYRGVCLMCASQQQHFEAATPNPRQIQSSTDGRWGIDQGWRLGKVERIQCFLFREHCRTVGSPRWSYSRAYSIKKAWTMSADFVV